jgi:hypothetical protein
MPGKRCLIVFVDPANPGNTYSRGPVPVWLREKMIAAGYDPKEKDRREAGSRRTI